MLRGIQKNMIYVQLPKEKYFEGAYFIIRSQTVAREPRQGEMVKEANKIILEMEPEGSKGLRKPGKSRRNGLSFFLYGGIAGAFAVALIWLVTLIVT